MAPGETGEEGGLGRYLGSRIERTGYFLVGVGVGADDVSHRAAAGSRWCTPDGEWRRVTKVLVTKAGTR